MKKILSLILLSLAGTGLLFSTAFAVDDPNLKKDNIASQNKGNDDYVNELIASDWFGSDFFGGTKTGEAGAQGLMIRIIGDMKNVMIAITILYMFVLVLRLFFGQGSEDDFKKWRIGILWSTIGILFMQIAYVAFNAMYNKEIGAGSAKALSEAVLWPIIHLLEVVASFLFLGIALVSFYRIITGGGNDDGYKKGISTIINAVIGFILVKISAFLVKSIYNGDVTCSGGFGPQDCSVATDPNLSETTRIIATLIQYMTGFVSVVTVLLIMYAGFMILTSSGDDTKVKKGKSIIKYIIIGMIIIASSVILFNFITGRDFSGIVGKYN